MKKLFLILLTIGFLTFTGAQERFSLGLVGTRFVNTDNSNKLTEIDNPLGYGVILGYALNENLTVALTWEYFKDDLKNSLGKETDYRAHFSAYYMPVNYNGISPYVSAGFVYTNRNYSYKNDDEKTDNLFNGRIGTGLDYTIIQNIGINADLGFYTDGLKFVGWTSSVGLRYGLNL